MGRILFVFFIVVPLLELYLLIKVGGEIGAFSTILLIISTALAGAILMKTQGRKVMQDAREAMFRGMFIEQQAFEGVLIFFGGILLLLPGLVTDFIGLLLLIPPIRSWLAKRWLDRKFTAGSRSTSSSYVHAEWLVEDPLTGKIERKVYRSDDSDVIDVEPIDKK